MIIEKVTKGEHFERGMRYNLIFNNGYSQYFTEAGLSELGREIKQLQTSDNSEYVRNCKQGEHDIKGSWEYRQCKKCGEYVAVG